MSGSLVVASSLTNTTLTSTNVTNVTSTTSTSSSNSLISASNLECQVALTADGIANAATAIAENAINRVETIAENLVTSAVLNAVNTTVGVVENAALSAVNSVTGMLVSDAASIANNVASSVGKLFSNTLSGIGTVVKLPIPDPVASSFGAGVPQSTLFATNSILSQMDSVKLGVLGAVSSVVRGISNILNLPNMLLRYGVNTVAQLESAINADLQQLAMAGSYSSLPGLLSTGGISTSGLNSFAGCACPSPSYAGYQDYAAMAGPIALTLTGSSDGLAAFYNPFLIDTSNLNGTAISGLPATVSSRTVNQITSTLTNTLSLTNITVAPPSYAASQSLFDGLFAISSQLGLVAVLEEMTAASLFGPTTQAQARALVTNTQVVVNPTVVALLVTAAGPQTITPPDSWFASLVSSSTLTATDVSGILTILSQLNKTPISIFTTQNATTPVSTVIRPIAGVQQFGTIVDATGGTGFGGTAVAATHTIVVPPNKTVTLPTGGGGSLPNVYWTGVPNIGYDSASLPSYVPSESEGSSGGGGSSSGSGSGGGSGGSSSPTTPVVIWNSEILNQTQKAVADGIVATTTATAEGAASASLPTAGLPSAPTVSMMVRGIERALNSNLKFLPITPKRAPTVLYGNVMASL